MKVHLYAYQPIDKITHAKYHDNLDILTPIQRYALALKSVKSKNINILQNILSFSNFTHLQLSKLIVHAVSTSNIHVIDMLLNAGAKLEYDNHRVWNLALSSKNQITIEFVRNKILSKGQKHTFRMVT